MINPHLLSRQVWSLLVNKKSSGKLVHPMSFHPCSMLSNVKVYLFDMKSEYRIILYKVCSPEIFGLVPLP